MGVRVRVEKIKRFNHQVLVHPRRLRISGEAKYQGPADRGDGRDDTLIIFSNREVGAYTWLRVFA